MSNPTVNMLWSWLRVFLAAFISATLIDIADGGLDSINWEAILIVGIVSVGPVIVNYLNPNDPRYGKGYVPPAE